MSLVETRLRQSGFVLPDVAAPVANYVPAVKTGNLVFVSGQGPTREGAPVFQGTVGEDVTEQVAYEAARLCALNSLAALKHEIGDLDLVTRLVKLLGFVASSPDFERHSFVMNGASDLLALAFGDAGRHARSAIGTNKLPFGIPVEIEIVAEVQAND